MPSQHIHFVDGASYEQMMGGWSRSVGEVFLDWLDPGTGKAWVDVGCGNGAFTELVVERCRAGSIIGIDPSEGQLAYARQRHAAGTAQFLRGDALSLALPDASVDYATMALVIFFVPDPPKGVAEMVRVTRSGGLVAAYAWDLLGGGFPWELVEEQIMAAGGEALMPPQPEAANLDVLAKLWKDAGLEQVEVRSITVDRSFPNFETYWSTAILTPGIAPVLSSMPLATVAEIKQRVKNLVRHDGNVVAQTARAHAVKGRVR